MIDNIDDDDDTPASPEILAELLSLAKAVQADCRYSKAQLFKEFDLTRYQVDKVRGQMTEFVHFAQFTDKFGKTIYRYSPAAIKLARGERS